MPQRAEPNWAKRKREGKWMRPKRDRDKLKSNPNPTLTLNPLSFKLSFKSGAWFINKHENSSLTNVGHNHSLRVWNTHTPTNVRAYGLQQSLCMPTAHKCPKGQNQIGLKGKERENEWGPTEIETSLSPTPVQLLTLNPLSSKLSFKWCYGL